VQNIISVLTDIWGRGGMVDATDLNN